MASFNPFRFQDLENLSVAKPYRTEEQIQQLRSLAAPLTADFEETVENVDADTISIPGQDKTMRLSGIDAWESYIRNNGGDINDPRIQGQILYASQLLGKKPEEMTAADIKEAGLMVKGKSAELFSQGAYIQDTGQVDRYGRKIVNAFTEDGKNISDVLNNPEFNTDYFSKYNRSFRRAKALREQQEAQFAPRKKATGFNEQGELETYFDPTTGNYVYGGVSLPSKELVDQFAPAIKAEKDAFVLNRPGYEKRH